MFVTGFTGYESGYEVNIMEYQLKELLFLADSVKIYNGGSSSEYPRGTKEYDAVMQEVKGMVKGSHEMPAFGVAIDALTRQFQTEGTAVEFCYDKPMEHNGMPFDRLFVRLEKEYFGVNLERFTDGKYQGRCFYLNLEHNANKLYELIKEM